MKQPAQPQLQLTERDLALCEFAFSYDGVDIAHIQAKFFPSPGARSACYARVGKLVDAGYLTATRLPSHYGIGSGPLFITLGPKVRLLLAKRLNCSVGELRRATRMQVPKQLAHHLTICDFRLAAELAVEGCDVVTDIEWIPEWELRSSPVKVKEPETETTLTVVADGAFTLTLRDESEQSFFYECDMATMTAPRRMRSRLRGWLLAAKMARVPVLWTTTTASRAHDLARLASQEAEELSLDPTIFWVTLHSAVTPATVLAAPIWQVVGGPSALSLLGTLEQLEASTIYPPQRVAEGAHA